MKTPDFLIIGAQRCGTTTLSSALAFHPQIFLVESNEEPKFFSREQEYANGTEYYLKKYFSFANGYKAVGEKSTEYMENSTVAARIYKFNPDMKLIYILRQPIERSVSNYWFSISNGVERRPINEAIRSEWGKCLKNPSKTTQVFSSRLYAYIDRSFYYDNLKPFYELFPNKNIQCIIFEKFINDTKKTINNLFLFLGLSPIDLPMEKIKVQRAVKRKETLDPKLYNELKSFFYEKNKKLPGLTGKNIRQFWEESP